MNGEAKKYEKETFGKFLYNKENGTVLGRTAKSWCEITVFYIIFYICLAAFWIACLAVFLKTLDPKVPRFYGKGTIIGVNPGVGYQPWIKENPDSTLIKFNLRDPESWKPYTKQMSEYLSRYSDTNGTRECTGSDSNDDLENNKEAVPCKFDLAPFKAAGCSEDREFGFKSGSPCIIISLNRLIGWKPTPYEGGSVPEEIKDRYKPGSIAINCQGAYDPDKEHIGRIKYIPPEGISGKYYPYVFVDGYQQPIAMAKFESLPRNKLVIVECRAYTLNIEHDISTRLGMVYFELFVEDKEVKKTDTS